MLWEGDSDVYGDVRACCAEHEPTKRLVRPPHKMPPARWHLTPNLDAKGPLSKEQVKTFFEDGAFVAA